MLNWSKQLAESLSGRKTQGRKVFVDVATTQQSELDVAYEELDAIRYRNKVIIKGIDVLLSKSQQKFQE